MTEEVPLKKVFKSIKDKENGGVASVKPKDSKDKLEEYFFEVLPDYDEDRVYASDIKKVIQWYNLLHKHDMLDLLSDEDVQEDVKDEEE